MAEKPIDLGLGRAYDELFTSQEERDDQKREKIIDIPLSELRTFKNHPFRVEVNDELREMAMNTPDDQTRQNIQRMIQQMEQG